MHVERRPDLDAAAMATRFVPLSCARVLRRETALSPLFTRALLCPQRPCHCATLSKLAIFLHCKS